jgi:hypothetical protein
LQRHVVVVTPVDGRNQFGAHAVGVGTSDVVAFQQDLVAAADTHHPVAEIVDAGGLVASAEEGENGHGQQEQMKAPP